jgi:hypothetical protein
MVIVGITPQQLRTLLPLQRIDGRYMRVKAKVQATVSHFSSNHKDRRRVRHMTRGIAYPEGQACEALDYSVETLSGEQLLWRNLFTKLCGYMW